MNNRFKGLLPGSELCIDLLDQDLGAEDEAIGYCSLGKAPSKHLISLHVKASRKLLFSLTG